MRFTEQGWFHALLVVSAVAVLGLPLFGGMIVSSARKGVNFVGQLPVNGTPLAKTRVLQGINEGFNAATFNRLHAPGPVETAAMVGQATVDEIKDSVGRLLKHGQELKAVRDGYDGEPGNMEITRAMNTLVTMTVEEMASMARRLEKRVGEIHIARTAPSHRAAASKSTMTAALAAAVLGVLMDPGDSPQAKEIDAARSADTTKKWALFGVMTGLAVGLVLLVLTETIASVDMGADAGVLFFAMLAVAVAPAANARDAKARALGMGSTTVAAFFLLLGDKLAELAGVSGGFVSGVKGHPYVAMAVMMVMVALLPQHLTNATIGTATRTVDAGQWAWSHTVGKKMRAASAADSSIMELTAIARGKQPVLPGGDEGAERHRPIYEEFLQKWTAFKQLPDEAQAAYLEKALPAQIEALAEQRAAELALQNDRGGPSAARRLGLG